MVNREHPRYAVAVDVLVHAGVSEIRGRTENVSYGGLCAEVERPVQLGEGVVVNLALVFPDEELSESIELGGRIVWCTPINQRFQLGIQFTNPDETAGRDLALFLRFLAERP